MSHSQTPAPPPLGAEPRNPDGTYRLYSDEQLASLRQLLVGTRNSLFTPFLRVFANLDTANARADKERERANALEREVRQTKAAHTQLRQDYAIEKQYVECLEGDLKAAEARIAQLEKERGELRQLLAGLWSEYRDQRCQFANDYPGDMWTKHEDVEIIAAVEAALAQVEATREGNIDAE